MSPARARLRWAVVRFELTGPERVLEAAGTLHLIHPPPVDGKIERIADNLRDAPPTAGFRIDDTTVDTVAGARMLAVRAAAR